MSNINNNMFAMWFYLVLFLISFTWLIYYRPKFSNISGYISFMVQQVIVLCFFSFMDLHFGSEKVRFVLAGLAFFYVFLMIFNAIIFSFTSISLFRSLKILALGGDFLITLKEVGFSIGLVLAVGIGVIVLNVLGGVVHYYSPKVTVDNDIVKIVLAASFLFMTLVFIIEQILSRNRKGYFFREDYSLYLSLFSTSRESVKMRIPEPNSLEELNSYVKNIGQAKKPENVVYILLESFRWDVMNEEVTPNMYNLSKSGLNFTNAYGDAIYTSLVWNVVYMDRPAYAISFDIKNWDKYNYYGSKPLRILKKAGYTNHLAISANFEWKNFHNRVRGEGDIVDNYFCGYSGTTEKRNMIDNRTTEKFTSWIKGWKSEDPFFMLLQLDSTHWTYYFDDDADIYSPYPPEEVNLGKLSTQKDIDKLFNRYKNGARHVDNKIGEVIKALKDSGKYDNTVIAVVSDHGEGFAPGRLGHTDMHENIKKIPVVIKFPSEKPEDLKALTSHRDIFPTIFDYLKIDGIDDKMLMGSSILDRKGQEAVLDCNGSVEVADLIFSDYIVRLKTKVKKGEITFTPVCFLNRDGNLIDSKSKNIDQEQWVKALKDIVR